MADVDNDPHIDVIVFGARTDVASSDDNSRVEPMWPLLTISLTASAATTTPFLGVEWRPLSRQDLVWVDEGRTSGVAVGEFDGAVRPVFSAFGGVWFSRHVGLSLGLGMARLTTTNRSGDTYRQRHWGVFRPSLDVRIGWLERRLRYPIPWFVLGVYGDVPSARDVSNAYTADEQAAADESARLERIRLGGVGGRAGVGVDYMVLPGLSLGLTFTVGLHASTFVGSDEGFTNLWMSTEGALLVTFEWPPITRVKNNAAQSSSMEGSGEVDPGR
jgi:hypothetical protein